MFYLMIVGPLIIVELLSSQIKKKFQALNALKEKQKF